MSQIRELIEGLFNGRNPGPGQVVTSFAEMTDRDPNKRPKVSARLLGLKEPKRETLPPADPDLAEAEKLIEELAARIDVADVEKLRAADRETKMLFAKRVRSQRSLNEERKNEQEAKAAAAAEEAKIEERNRLARLGYEAAKAERDQ